MKAQLLGKDLRSISEVNQVVKSINTQNEFDELFVFLFEDDRLLKMRAVDAVEKITVTRPELLVSHKKDILGFLSTAKDKEFKWHIALIVSRLALESNELNKAFTTLKQWVLNTSESKIVRVNALQSLFDLSRKDKNYEVELLETISIVEKERVPSLNARIKKLNIKNENGESV